MRKERKKNLNSRRLESQARVPAKLIRDFNIPFEPDLLVSARYFEVHRAGSLSPEKRLVLAILEDAIACFRQGAGARTRRQRALSQEAEQWILEKNGNWFFSFETVCELLGVNPHYLRRGLLLWKEKTPKQTSHNRAASIFPRKTGTGRKDRAWQHAVRARLDRPGPFKAQAA